MSHRHDSARVVAGPRQLAQQGAIAEFLDVPERTLIHWRQVGKGPRWIKVGRHVRYRWSDIEAWLDQQAAPGTAVAR